MTDEKKDKDSPEGVFAAAATLRRFRELDSKVKDAQKDVAERGAEMMKNLNPDQREAVMQQMLKIFDSGEKSTAGEARAMFDAMKRMNELRSMLKAAQDRVDQGGDELGKNFTEEQKRAYMRDTLRRFEENLIPKIPDARTRTKTMVIVVVLDICDRQILQGLPSGDEWARLKDILKEKPEALKVVSTLETAISKYDDDLRAAVAQGEADEEQMRKAHYGLISKLLLGKLKALGLAGSAQAEAAQTKTPKPAETEEPAKETAEETKDETKG